MRRGAGGPFVLIAHRTRFPDAPRPGTLVDPWHWSRTLVGSNVMHLSNQSLLVIIIVGIVAGWLAGRVVEGGGFGLIGDLLVGLVGALIGDWLLPRLGLHLGVGLVGA